VQALTNRLGEVPPDRFRYLIIDEAHHAASPSYQTLLGHFTPRFTLGLTATPDRPDGRPILELFRDAAHRLTLEEAIKQGELVPIRCVRVKTNIDLSRIRFNEIQYNRQDLEQTVMVPARDQLIVDTYLDHVKGRKGVTFCVNVRHGEQLAQLYRQHGIPARAVSGGMKPDERDQVLDQYANGQLRMLCACDILNEGWDCPDVEVLIMARPTLSRIIYMQQLGRGTRKAPGKESLLVFDLVDNPGRYNAALNLHRLTGTRKYRKGALVLATEEEIAEEQRQLEEGRKPEILLNLGLWSEGVEEVDLFDWQKTAKDMLSLSDLESRLAVSQGYLRSKVQSGELQPDHQLDMGSRSYHYFSKDRVKAIAQQFDIKPVTKENIRELFLNFCETMDMSASYKPVLLLCLLDCVDETGKAPIESLTAAFRDYYLQRKAAGLPAEKGNKRMARVEDLSDAEIQQLMLQMPFRKFAQRKYLHYARDVSQVRFDKRLWKALGEGDMAKLKGIAEKRIGGYFEDA
jgi:superfamily II DNA or RNA helicase